MPNSYGQNICERSLQGFPNRYNQKLIILPLKHYEIFRKTGIVGCDNLPESTSPADATGASNITAETSKSKRPLPPSTAHMIGWTLSKEVIINKPLILFRNMITIHSSLTVMI